jgi:acylphosphatase
VERRCIGVYGLVQGVGFRFAIQRAAESRGVAGWVRNRPDGAVEAVFEGEGEDVEALVDFCRRGPRGAVVERVEVSSGSAEGLSGFRVVG